MKGLVLVSSLALVLMLLFGCAAQQTATAPTQQPAAQPAPTPPPVQPKTTQPAAPPAPPPFQPIHLSYLMANTDQQGRPQDMRFDYYLDEKTTCNGRPALNGFMGATKQGQPGAGYVKMTVYLDTGEAVYSDQMGDSDLAFDTAKPKIADFDFAFYPQTIVARGGKNILSADIWNATVPVLLKNVATFGGVGDYSIRQSGIGTVAGLACKNFSVSIKSSNMEGQILLCVHQLDDLELSFLSSAGFAAGENGPSWHLTAISREKSSIAYYPQCLAPVVCKALSKPTQQERDACNAGGNSLETKRDEKGCVASFDCITQEERARESLTNSQRPGCQIDEQFVKEAAGCWKQWGNVNYQNGNDGCITKVECNLPPPGQGGPQTGG